MLKIARILLAASALLMSAGVLGADILELYREAVAKDARYTSAKAAHAAAQEKLPQGLSGLLPNASLSANTTYNDTDSSLSDNRRYNSNGYTLSATQPLYRRQNLAVYEQAKHQVAQAEARLALAAQDLTLRVSQAYFDILLAGNEVELARAQKAAISEQLAQAKRNFEVGAATITDTHEAQARFDLVTSREIAALNDLEIKRRALEQIVGRRVETLRPLKEELGLQPPSPEDMENWVAQAQDKNPQVRAQLQALEIATEEIARSRGGHHPTLDLVATHSDTSSGSSTFAGARSDVESTALSLQFNLPLYQGGGTASRVREALALKDQALADLDTARRDAVFLTRQAYLGVTSGIAQVRALEQALISSRSQLDSTQLGQEVGVRTGVDVLNVQQQFYSARRDLYAARYNYILSHLRLKAAAGALAEADLKNVNDSLQ